MHTTSQFQKSSDFVMIATGINPFVIMQHSSRQDIERHTKSLYMSYNAYMKTYECNKAIEAEDFPFATPACQWFLRKSAL